MNNILLLGANGQLGRSFLEHQELSTFGHIVAASRDGARFDGGSAEVADLSSPATLSTLLDKVQPAIIINAAAYTAVDRAEQEESLATTVNGEAVAVIARWAAAHHAMVVHYSTDYVFDGQASMPYPVDAATAPLGAYGRSKLAGEQALQASGAAYLLLRTAWVYAPHGHNFLRTMLRLGADRAELRVVADQYGAPTSTDTIVNATLAALTTWQNADATQRGAMQGIYHLVASGHTSWHGFASAIFEKAHARGLIPQLPRVLPIATAEYPTPAKRPAWSVLDNKSFQQRFGYALADWQEGLDQVIDTLAKQAR
ncbi:dTDP-4-dehydrorhamnose reductase [Dyella nitratireducens]|uniref:dTDP-4-dehydrorhamnose reductase n=1 Tax=Dyella nitratireducens TaxID=1849580 RepID=A0ABQ1FPR6_9GAMM|nr:dTDP-4-dehydrorhamnose reductase [Dyella nitratireducens]GGA25551.1 NAD(P)-dependent oxidoreductase [Dyella nitratireducens]GLQ43670.1 NAD(P)-dependent oxidoreductase [Dyella nitratireducens]